MLIFSALEVYFILNKLKLQTSHGCRKPAELTDNRGNIALLARAEEVGPVVASA